MGATADHESSDTRKAELAMLKDSGQLFRGRRGLPMRGCLIVTFNRIRPVVPGFQSHSARV